MSIKRETRTRGTVEAQRERVAARRVVVAQLRKDGLSMRQIAERVGVSAQTVCGDLAALYEMSGQSETTPPAPPILTERPDSWQGLADAAIESLRVQAERGGVGSVSAAKELARLAVAQVEAERLAECQAHHVDRRHLGSARVVVGDDGGLTKEQFAAALLHVFNVTRSYILNGLVPAFKHDYGIDLTDWAGVYLDRAAGQLERIRWEDISDPLLDEIREIEELENESKRDDPRR